MFKTLITFLLPDSIQKKMRVQILRFTISKLRNEDWFRFHTEFWDFVTLCGTDVLEITLLCLPYRMLYKEADRLLDVVCKRLIATDPASVDRRRDGVFLGLRDTARFLQKDPDPEKQIAALMVYAVIDKYTHVVRKGSLVAKTAAVDSLLQDLTPGEGKVDLAQELQLLELGGWIDDLSTVHRICKQLPAKRGGEAELRRETDRLLQVRAEMDLFYANIINVVDARLLTADAAGGYGKDEGGAGFPDDGYGAEPSTPDRKVLLFAGALNSCITRYKSHLKRSSGYGAGKKAGIGRIA
jgi:hypothetical protein